ncbi:MAG: hypothetical protein LBT12_05665 [Oscillospiraceae bacterium]|jgi:hypothetical protein|nr:hypothetical protein [Oscillospiraceae bacterium]
MRIDTHFYGFDQPGDNRNKIGSIALPNFNSFYFNTKSAPAMSDDKYRDAIIEQARKDAARGVSYSKSSESMSLMKSYTSVASPDRKAIITGGLNQLFGNGSTPAVHKSQYLNLIEILLGETKFTHNGNRPQLTYAEFKDADGNVIADYSNGGWNTYPTDAENARTSEFLQIYQDAWRSAENGGRTEPTLADPAGLDVMV